MPEITWAPIIPLIGGFPIGTQMALKTAPEFIGSYDGFQANDKLYVDYMKQNGHELEYRDLLQDRREQHVDIIVCTPPCAGLSRLNTGESEDVAGASCPVNEWMYQCLEDAIALFTAKVVIIENAPNLYTSAGDTIREKLIEICVSHGYSGTFYKTNTKHHGIPQNRDRTFFFAWNSATAPKLPWRRRPSVTFKEFMSADLRGQIHQDQLITPNILDKDGHYNYIKEKYGNPFEAMAETGDYSSFKFIMYRGEFDSYLEWCKNQNVERWLRIAEHRKSKLDQNKDAWDSSIRCFHDTCGAIVMRNVTDMMHPTEERSITLREAMRLMGMPKDFVIPNGVAGTQKLTQNVPTVTARDMVLLALEYIRGNLNDSGNTVVKQDNNHMKTEVEEAAVCNLEEFF